jgi:hypothetical protein
VRLRFTLAGAVGLATAAFFLLSLSICVVDISVSMVLMFGEESHWRSIAFVSLDSACRLLVERLGEEHQEQHGGQLFSFPCFMHILCCASALLHSAHFYFLLSFFFFFSGCGRLLAPVRATHL